MTKTAAVWQRGGKEFQRTLSTAAIHDGLIYMPTLTGIVHCLDAETGENHWSYDAFASIWLEFES